MCTLETVPDDLKGIRIIHTRWKMYLDYLDRHGDEYANVFVSDTRDVIFQGDVFAAFDDCTNWLGFTTETDDIRGSKTGDPTNYDWLVSFFGRAEADKLVDKKIICCGTVIASVREMKIFCRIMWELLKAETILGHEQALMNYSVYNKLLPIENVVEIDVQSGEILTNDATQHGTNIRGNKILRGDGGVPKVVHQYDRQEDLAMFVDKLYRDKNFSVDLTFNDTRSLLEQVISLLYADKTVEATRLFLKIFFAVTNFSVHVRALTKIWELALRNDLTPTIELLEVAVQNALLASREIFYHDLLNACANLIRAQKKNHTVDPVFKNCLVNSFAKLVKYNTEAGNFDAADICQRLCNKINAAGN